MARLDSFCQTFRVMSRDTCTVTMSIYGESDCLSVVLAWMVFRKAAERTGSRSRDKSTLNKVRSAHIPQCYIHVPRQPPHLSRNPASIQLSHSIIARTLHGKPIKSARAWRGSFAFPFSGQLGSARHNMETDVQTRRRIIKPAGA